MTRHQVHADDDPPPLAKAGKIGAPRSERKPGDLMREMAAGPRHSLY